MVDVAKIAKIVDDAARNAKAIKQISAKNKISVAHFLQKPSKSGAANIMLVTHASKELNIKKVIKHLSNYKKIFKKIIMIRVRDLKKL